jgi:diacylglycerol kinase family enzyme
MRRVLIVNPVASRVSREGTERVVAALSVRDPVDVRRTQGPGHAAELAQDIGDDCEAVYVFAGDGGYNEVVNGVHADVPVGFIPGGATSVLPRALGLPRDPVACARRLAAAPRRRRIALGRVTFVPVGAGNDGPSVSRRFTFCAGVGLDAELVRAVDRRGRTSGRRPGDLAFASELVRILARSRARVDAGLEIEDHGRCAFVLASNCDPYSYVGPLPIRAAPVARFELGLDLVAPRRMRPPDVPRFLWWVLANPGQQRSGDVIYVHDTDRATVRCDAPTPLQVDGEDLGDVERVILEAERDALTVLV